MGAPAASLEDRLARIETLLSELVSRRPKRLLSKRAAARLLGVDRCTTLEGLIRSGVLHLVLGKIPDTEIDRLLAEGVPEVKAKSRRRPAAQDEAAAIRAIKV